MSMTDQTVFKIINCYDSHVHLLATGQVASGLELSSIKKISDLEFIKIVPRFFRADWLVGFGWDHHHWNLKDQWPTKFDLDQYFPNEPVYFSRIDGHAGWFNSIGYKKLLDLGFQFSNPKYRNQIPSTSGSASGILLDQAHIDAMILLPPFSQSQNREFLKSAGRLFNEAGFTHVRDMSSNLSDWNQLDQLLINQEFSLCVEGNITIENSSDLERGLSEFLEVKKNFNPFLRIKGLKVFVDGSLGSKTAALFENYSQTEQAGLLFWSESEIKQVIRACWQIKAEVSFHTIGDRAVDLVVRCARQVSADGLLGRINLEHVQLIKPETIQMMKPLHVVCHMQPCHWLSDQSWIEQTISKSTQNRLFNWERIRKNKIELHFGSDSPIEKTSLLRNFQALKRSAQKGIPGLSDDPFQFHSHPDSNWTQSATYFNEEKIVKVVFNKRTIFET
jgi:predicted amidohydrolase YtcJ